MGKMVLAGRREEPAGVGGVTNALEAGPDVGRSPDASAASAAPAQRADEDRPPGRDLVQFSAATPSGRATSAVHLPGHCSSAFSTTSAQEFLRDRRRTGTQKLKTGVDSRITGAWLHTHNLHRGTDQEQICSQKNYERWENFDDAMTNAFGDNWGEEHPELDAQIIYDAAGRMPHGRLGIANELFTKTEKSKIKSRRVSVSQPVRSAKEDRLERENARLKRDNKRLRGIDLVVQSLAEKGGVDYDAIMQLVAPELATSDSEVEFERGRDADRSHETEKGMGSKTGGSPSREKGHDIDDDADDIYDNEGDDDGYGYGDDDGYGYSDDQYGLGRGDDYDL